MPNTRSQTDRVNSPAPRSTLWLRLPVLVALLILFGRLAIGLHRAHHLPAAWEALGVPEATPDFADTRTITHSIDSVLTGRNPYVDRSFDPWHRLYNYPPIWLELRHLGIRSTTTKWLAAFFEAAFFCSCFLLFRARNWITAGIIFFAVLSWPVLFALERGNTDLLIFAILATGALWIGRGGRPLSAAKQTVLIVLLTILKVFPVVAVLAMVRNRRMVWKAFAASLLAIVALVASSGSKLLPTIRNTPQEEYQSFGSVPLAEFLGKPNHRLAIAIVLAASGILIGLRRRDSFTRGLPQIDLSSARGFLAAAGLSIYCFIFFCGSSYDYRLIFLLLPLMYLVEDLNEHLEIVPLAAAAVLLLFIFCAPLASVSPRALLDGLVFVGACAWMTDTLRRALSLPSASQMDSEVLSGDALNA